MKIFTTSFLLFLVSFNIEAQETILRSDFSVRDFFIARDSIFLIEKRDVKIFDKKNVVKNYFIGGYGLKIFDDYENNNIITVSNELENTVSSLRFYNKSSKKVEDVFYYKEGKSLDALIVKNLKLAILSLDNNKIIVVNYSKKPTFNVIHEINLNSISRKIIYNNNALFYINDLGEFYKYDFSTKKNTLLYVTGKKILDFSIFNNYMIYATIDGEIVKHNNKSNTNETLKIDNNFVITSVKFKQNKLICGTFKGAIIVLDVENMVIIKQLNYHKRSILSIVNKNNDKLYSSSIDKTIKQLKIN